MQALSRLSNNVLLNFDKISDLVMNINYHLQKAYDFRMEEQQAKHYAFEIYDSADYFKE